MSKSGSADADAQRVVWVFNGARNHFPSGVFASRARAEDWIRENRLSGTLTVYPIDRGIYDWAMGHGSFTPKRDEHRTPDFIANFSSATQEHYHYEQGRGPDDECD